MSTLLILILHLALQIKTHKHCPVVRCLRR